MKRSTIYLTLLALVAGAMTLTADEPPSLWEKNCVKCHGVDGKGDTKMGKKLDIKDLTDAKFQASFTDKDATKAIKEGIKDGDKIRMKAVEGLTDDNIKELIAKVRAFKKG